jgi:outer membrane protein assembly factor BamB
MKNLFTCLLLCVTSIASTEGADWPMHRGDATRSGYTSDQLPTTPSLAWRYHSLHPPVPAWPRDDRMWFDLAPEVVIVGDLLVFGDSADGRVIALDATTGETRWTFFTGAPVRFAPALYKDQVYVVSDDGYLYCLAAADGALQNRWRPGPSDEMILGNGRMVSRWTARGGPVVRDGVVYFAAGIWQSDGVYLRAIDAETHALLWENKDAGKIYMAQPHGGAMAESGISPQGYLVATADKLLVPTGRAVPAAFTRADGKFLYYHLQVNGRTGGTQAVAVDDRFYNGGTAFQLESGTLVEKLAIGNYAAMPGALVVGTAKGLRVYKPTETTAPDRKGTPVKTLKHEAAWAIENVDAGAAVIAAGDAIICGGSATVAVVDVRTQEVIWTAEVDGAAYGLAVAGGRLYVTTTKGTIYCFDGAGHAAPIEHRPTPQADVAAKYAAAADEIIAQTGVKDGFCLDTACGDGELALALALKTNLQIYALCPTAAEAAYARKKLSAAGVYGTRVTVHVGTPDQHPYGKYFADLIVSARSLDDGPLPVKAEAPPRVLRPYGGVVCTGRPGEMKLFRRGALAKSGSWTHQYSDLGNSCYSGDELVQGSLHALWFRDVDLEMPQRHGRGPAPVYHAGRMFVEGIDAVRAVDAYNGRNLWEFALPGVLAAYSADHLSGTAVTGSNLCLAGDFVYVHDKKRCYRLDAATGKKIGEFTAPAYADGEPGTWGYVACDGKLLYGSLPNRKHNLRYNWRRADMSELHSESTTFFALDAETGELRWRYDAQESIRHNAIAIGEGTVYLVDRQIAEEDKLDPNAQLVDGKLPVITKVKQPEGTLVALNATTGELAWNAPHAFGTMLVYSSQYDALLLGYQSTRFKLPSEVGGRLAVFRGRSGEKLWDKPATYTTRPWISEYTVYAQGGAWDLLSGDARPFELKRSYGCGQIAASKHMMLFRSATLGYQSTAPDAKVENYGGLRPGCWINALPVGGIVLLPDASAGCSCSYQNRSWMALEGNP